MSGPNLAIAVTGTQNSLIFVRDRGAARGVFSRRSVTCVLVDLVRGRKRVCSLLAFRSAVSDGLWKLDAMGIPKDAAQKVEPIDRFKRLGAPDGEIERVFREPESAEHADIAP